MKRDQRTGNQGLASDAPDQSWALTHSSSHLLAYTQIGRQRGPTVAGTVLQVPVPLSPSLRAGDTKKERAWLNSNLPFSGECASGVDPCGP